MLQGEGARWARAVSWDRRRRRGSINSGSDRRGGRHRDVRRLPWWNGPSPSRRQGDAPGPWGNVATSAASGRSGPRRPTCAMRVSGGVSTLCAPRARRGSPGLLSSLGGLARVARPLRRVIAQPKRGERARRPVAMPVLRWPGRAVL
eukprot:3002464-Alexandrium_andersonii.AAC.1